MWNTQAYILDTALQPVPAGVTGELYIAGTQLARGYLNRPDLTAERFIANPYGPPGSRMYRTGDLARWRTDGVLEYLGRADAQIKIRGFRIEPGEIETALTSHPTIAQAAVLVREDQPGDKRLIAYLTTTSAPADINTTTSAPTPPDDSPTTWCQPRSWSWRPCRSPPTANSTAAPCPPPTTRYSPPAGHPATTARTPSAQLFAEVLGLPDVGIDDNFFELGGHSLLATRLVSRIRSALGVEVGIRALFETPTVAGLVTQLDRAGDGVRARLGVRGAS